MKNVQVTIALYFALISPLHQSAVIGCIMAKFGVQVATHQASTSSKPISGAFQSIFQVVQIPKMEEHLAIVGSRSKTSQLVYIGKGGNATNISLPHSFLNSLDVSQDGKTFVVDIEMIDAKGPRLAIGNIHTREFRIIRGRTNGHFLNKSAVIYQDFWGCDSLSANPKLFVRDLLSGKERKLCNAVSGFILRDVSPCGRYVIGAREEERHVRSIWMFDLITSNWTQIQGSNRLGENDFPVFSPDSKYIYYVRRKNIDELWRVRIDGKFRSKIWNSNSAPYLVYPSFLNDGRLLLMVGNVPTILTLMAGKVQISRL